MIGWLRHAALAAGCLLAHVTALSAPAVAPVQDAADVLHGVTVRDPYRRFENLVDPDTREWLRAQGRYAAEQLARIEGRDAMQARIQALSRASGDAVRGIVRLPGERYYYLKRKAGQDQYKLMMRTGLYGPERVLVDPEPLARKTGVPHAVNYFIPSWDGRTVAYGMSAGGSEDASLYLLDTGSGKVIGRPIPRVLESLVSWAPDSRSLTFNQVRKQPRGAPVTELYMDSTVFHLELRPGVKPRPLFGPLINRELKLQRLDVAGIVFDPQSRFMVARTTDTTVPEGKLFVAPVSMLKAAVIPWRQISDFDDKITDVALRRDTLYLRTYAGAPRGRVVALDLATPQLQRAVTVVPEPKSGVLLDFTLGRNVLFAQVREGFRVRLQRFDGTATEGVDVAPAHAGNAFALPDPAHAYDDVLFDSTGWTEPVRVMRSLPNGATRDTGLLEARMPPNAPEVAVSEVQVTSHDGVQVPLAILHRQGLKLDGSNPTLLVGYGAYGHSFEAWFDPRALAWIEQGGVLAYANVRGSGVHGDAWYRAGFKATKPNTWKDGIACARYLIERGYASPKTLGVWGTSAGGIFVGRAVTAAPELFAAAIFDVGVLDAVRSEESANGATNVSEFGTVKDGQEFRALLEMSTYHHIRDGVPYPAVLLVHGMNDPRVEVWHSAKTAARLQAASSSGRPVLLRLDEQAGHGLGSTARQGRSKLADVYSFLLWQFGKTGAAREQ